MSTVVAMQSVYINIVTTWEFRFKLLYVYSDACVVISYLSTNRFPLDTIQLPDIVWRHLLMRVFPQEVAGLLDHSGSEF